MTIEEYFGSWMQVIDKDTLQITLNKLSLIKEPLCPCRRDIFSAFRHCSYDNLRIVILGQDPYPDMINGTVPVATGIAFANRASTPENMFSPSLNILKESVIDFSIPHSHVNFDPTLESWEKQGVLMLNSALTCIAGRPSVHLLLWRPFISTFLYNLSHTKCGISYVLFGKAACSYLPCISQRFNSVFPQYHPSWYARNHQAMPSKLWHDLQKLAIYQNGYGIKWYDEEQQQENTKCHSL